jgi:hypothetical protein
MVEAKRTLVKSSPELWAELSDPAALARHLEAFGGVQLTGARDESLVEWEGERARGRITLEPSGFGTRVTLQAAVADRVPPAPPVAPLPAPAPAPRPGFWARVFRRRRAQAPVPAPLPEPPAAPPLPPLSDAAALAALTGVLDALGHAHHRPFSRA